MQNQLILGDKLEVLRSIPNESIDLIYIDQSFFSNRNYAVIWAAKVKSAVFISKATVMGVFIFEFMFSSKFLTFDKIKLYLH